MTFIVFYLIIIFIFFSLFLIQTVRYGILEKRSYEIKDHYLSLVTQKRLIEKKNFLRNDEKDLLKTLNKIYKEEYIIPQVHLSDLAEVKTGYRDHDNLYHELSRIIFDYVIFDKNFEPILVIELNGSSHFLKNRINRDAIAKNLTNNLQINLVSLVPSDRFDEIKIKNQIDKELKEYSFGKLQI